MWQGVLLPRYRVDEEEEGVAKPATPMNYVKDALELASMRQPIAADALSALEVRLSKTGGNAEPH